MADANPAAARAQILARIRSNLGVRGDEPGRRGRAQSRLRNPQVNLIPERALKSRAELLKQFQLMLEKSEAKVFRLRSLNALAEALAGALRDHNLPLRLRAGSDKIFDGLRGQAGLLEILSGRPDANDTAGLSRAVIGASETGTLFLVSGQENPSTLNFLPEVHFAVILADDIAGSYEEAWAKLRQIYGPGRMPRTVNLISGPSRTADIEQTLVTGAHGPRKLVVFLIGP
ncbi:MAG TPA: LUD domain-containing protein [Hyphomicrobiales bacterium]|nr:LUD domain-containing protein [Hyphomicrobiales bacterium]